MERQGEKEQLEIDRQIKEIEGARERSGGLDRQTDRQIDRQTDRQT